MFITEEQLKRYDELATKIAEHENPDVLTEEEQEEFMQLDALSAAYNNYDLLGEIEEEAFTRVWFDRSDPDTESDKVREAMQQAIEEYDIDPEECDDFYHGYWSGILALSRFLSGYYGEDLDNLRAGDGLLDT